MPFKPLSKKSSNRQGSVVPLVARLLPLFISSIAFAVDYGAIVVAQHELQNAADNASTGTLKVLSYSNTDSADLAAFETLTANFFHRQPISFDMQQDVHYGNWDSETRTFTQGDRECTVPSVGDTSDATIPSGVSAVRIRLTRSVARGNGLRLFFAPILGRILQAFKLKQFQLVQMVVLDLSGWNQSGYTTLPELKVTILTKAISAQDPSTKMETSAATAQ